MSGKASEGLDSVRKRFVLEDRLERMGIGSRFDGGQILHNYFEHN